MGPEPPPCIAISEMGRKLCSAQGVDVDYLAVDRARGLSALMPGSGFWWFGYAIKIG